MNQNEAAYNPRILVFSTEMISDPGIDLAGIMHRHYSSSVLVIQVPCSSCIKPSWILYAIEKGFEGVFIAADGADCAVTPDCSRLTAAVVKAAQKKMKEQGIETKRLKMAAICSVCAEGFTNHMAAFGKVLAALNPGQKELPGGTVPTKKRE